MNASCSFKFNLLLRVAIVPSVVEVLGLSPAESFHYRVLMLSQVAIVLTHRSGLTRATTLTKYRGIRDVGTGFD